MRNEIRGLRRKLVHIPLIATGVLAILCGCGVLLFSESGKERREFKRAVSKARKELQEAEQAAKSEMQPSEQTTKQNANVQRRNAFGLLRAVWFLAETLHRIVRSK
jgi:hypothetical protein